jgi:hypothetical protein
MATPPVLSADLASEPTPSTEVLIRTAHHSRTDIVTKHTRPKTPATSVAVGARIHIDVPAADDVRAGTGITIERLCATCVRPGVFRIESHPWLCRELSFQDLVAGVPAGNGYRMTHKVASSGWSSLICVFSAPLSVSRRRAIEEELRGLGAHFGSTFGPGGFALSVPPDVPIDPILIALQAEKVRGAFGFLVLSWGALARENCSLSMHWSASFS